MRRLMRPVVWTGVALAVGALLVMLYRPGYQRRQRIERRLATQERANLELEARRAALAERVRLLQDDPLTLEREARQQLGLVYPGEVIYKFPPTGDTSAP